jgi:hypothetical protein
VDFSPKINTRGSNTEFYINFIPTRMHLLSLENGLVNTKVIFLSLPFGH